MDAARPRWTRRLGWSLLVLILLVLYWRALGGEALHWDDNLTLSDPVLTAPFVEAVTTAFTTTRDGQWWPLLRLSWWLQEATLGASAEASHAVNLALFVALVLGGGGGLLRRAGLPTRVALLAVALWALHPVRVESVAWLTARKGLLATLFVLGAALPLATGKKQPGWIGIGTSVLHFMLALLTKSVLAPMAGVLALWVWSQRGATAAARDTGGHFLAVAGVAVVALLVGGTGPGAERPDALVAVPLHSHAMYLLRWHWPRHLAAVYPVPEHPWPLALAGVTVWAAVSIWAVLEARRGWRAPVVLVALWTLPLLPVLGPFPLAFWGADRWSLIPSLALSIAAAWSLDKMWGRAAAAGAPWRWGVGAGTAVLNPALAQAPPAGCSRTDPSTVGRGR